MSRFSAVLLLALTSACVGTMDSLHTVKGQAPQAHGHAAPPPAAEMTGSVSDDEVWLGALRAARFADLLRNQIEADTESASPMVAPEFYAKLSAGLAATSNAAIDRLALPLMREQVPLAAARAALQFFSSPEGVVIANKLSASSFSKLTDAESAALEQFTRSPSGMALYAFFGNPVVLPTIVDGICNYAP